MKKLFVISLAIMMLALNSMVYAEQNIEWNLTPSDWATEDVRRADELGILPDKISGYVNAMPRENFCDILYGLLCKITTGEIEKIDAPNVFMDIDKISVNYLAAIDVVNGVEKNVFAPDKLLTREQAATILDRTIKHLNIEKDFNEKSKFIDDDNISEWAKESVYRMLNMNIMIGDDKGCFNPQKYCTTEEMIVAIMRVYDDW